MCIVYVATLLWDNVNYFSFDSLIVLWYDLPVFISVMSLANIIIVTMPTRQALVGNVP